MATAKLSDAELRELVKPKGTSWVTLAMFAVAVMLFSLAWRGAWTGTLPVPAVIAIATFANYFFFTCMHEAVHGAVSQNKLLNGIIGRIAATAFVAPFLGFRFAHLEHHRFTNHSSKDPDLWSGKPALVLRWLTQDLYYYKVLIFAYKKHNTRTALNVLWQMGLNILFGYWCVRQGKGMVVLIAWLIPARLAIAWLSFAFNYLPHLPYSAEQDTVYKKTSVRPNSWLTVPLLAQNFHNIHHLYPAARFYKYTRIWESEKDRLLALETPVR